MLSFHSRYFRFQQLALGLLAAGAAAQASIVTPEGTSTPFEGAAIYPAYTVKTDNGPVTVKLSGKGVRKEFSFVKVYVAASYVQDVDQFRGEAKANLGDAVSGQRVRVLQLSMLRGLGASTIKSKFQEALFDYNGVADSNAVESVFKQFNFGLDKGDTALLVTFPDGANQKLVIEAKGKTALESAPGLGDDFWKIWFGKGDSGIVALQKNLVGG